MKIKKQRMSSLTKVPTNIFLGTTNVELSLLQRELFPSRELFLQIYSVNWFSELEWNMQVQTNQMYYTRFPREIQIHSDLDVLNTGSLSQNKIHIQSALSITAKLLMLQRNPDEDNSFQTLPW